MSDVLGKEDLPKWNLVAWRIMVMPNWWNSFAIGVISSLISHPGLQHLYCIVWTVKLKDFAILSADYAIASIQSGYSSVRERS